MPESLVRSGNILRPLFSAIKIKTIDAHAIEQRRAWPENHHSLFIWDIHDETIAVEEKHADGSFKCREIYTPGQSVCAAVYEHDTLYGLCAMMLTADTLETHYMDTQPGDHSLRGRFTLIAAHIALCIAQDRNLNSLRIIDPLNTKLASLHTRFGYVFTSPPTLSADGQYPCMVVSTKKLEQYCATERNKDFNPL